MDNEEFSYIVARLWYPDKKIDWKNLCIYTYGSEIQTNTIKGAENFLSYVKRQSDRDTEQGYNKYSTYNSKTNPYKIYKLSFEELK